MTKTQGNMRELLTRIGIGQFNATMVIQSMFMAPATTDPKSSSIIILVQHLQKEIVKMGWPIRVTGYLDTPTANALAEIVGPGWESRSWGDNVSAVVNARARGKMIAGEIAAAKTTALPEPKAAVGFWDPPVLPIVPGGIVTYAVAGLVAYHLLGKKRK